jgi:hypothetical protein
VFQPQNRNDAIFNNTIIFNISTGNNLVLSGADSVLKLDFTIKGSASGNVANTVLLNKCEHMDFSKGYVSFTVVLY